MSPLQRIIVWLIACRAPECSLAAEPLPQSILVLDQLEVSGPFYYAEAVLSSADDYYAAAADPPKDWFFRASRWLEKENAKYAERVRAAERERDTW
jgi:hypothetical protein